jgi:hypothetical protein
MFIGTHLEQRDDEIIKKKMLEEEYENPITTKQGSKLCLGLENSSYHEISIKENIGLTELFSSCTKQIFKPNEELEKKSSILIKLFKHDSQKKEKKVVLDDFLTILSKKNLLETIDEEYEEILNERKNENKITYVVSDDEDQFQKDELIESQKKKIEELKFKIFELEKINNDLLIENKKLKKF